MLIFLPALQLGIQKYTGSYIDWGDGDGFDDTGDTGDVAVNRKIDFNIIDKYAGGTVSTGTLKIYDENGIELDSLDISSSTVTGETYKSGEPLYARLINGNAKKWWKFTVPYMSQADVDSQTNNPKTLYFFSIGSYSCKVTDQAGNQMSDTGNYNHTATGDQATFTVNFWVSSDGTGIMESEPEDPLNNLHWYCVLYLKCYNTNYEYIDVTGWDNSWSRGTANWYAERLDPRPLTKWKQGQSYVEEGGVKYNGAASFTFTADFTSYTGSTADFVFYLEFYSDPSYMIGHGNAGPNHYQATTLTLNLQS